MENCIYVESMINVVELSLNPTGVIAWIHREHSASK